MTESKGREENGVYICERAGKEQERESHPAALIVLMTRLCAKFVSHVTCLWSYYFLIWMEGSKKLVVPPHSTVTLVPRLALVLFLFNHMPGIIEHTNSVHAIYRGPKWTIYANLTKIGADSCTRAYKWIDIVLTELHMLSYCKHVKSPTNKL